MLAFKDVVFSYDDSGNVLDGLCLDVSPGEIVALVGANGAGKTTITRLATALEHPFSGTVVVGERSTDGLSPEDLSRSVAYLFQHVDQQLFSSSVRDEVGFAPRNAGCSPAEVLERTEQALERVGLTGASSTHPFDLSLANRKLVGLASALAQRPRLLILDEPTQGMDRKHMALVSRIVEEEAARGCTVLVVTHDLGFVAEAVHRVVLVEKGRVVEDLPAAKVVTDPVINQRLGLNMPAVPSLSVALRLPGTPVKFAEVVRALSTVAAGRTRQ